MIDFRPHIAEPFLLRWVSQPQSVKGKLLPYLPIAALTLVVAYEASALTAVDIAEIGPSFCTQLTSLASHLPAPAACKKGVMPDRFPITNDLYSLATLTILAVTTFTARHQWSGYAILISHMVKCKSLTYTSSRNRRAIEDQVRKANVFFDKLAGFSPIILVIVAVLVGMLAIAQHRNGAFAVLAPDGRPEIQWAREAYKTWWASPHKSTLAAGIYLSVGILALYIITIQNIVGPRVLLALWRARNDFSVAADYVNTDGQYGWDPVRRILSATYCQIAIHGVALAAIGVTLPPQGVSNPVYVVAAAQWLITLPIYVFLPILLTKNKVELYKEREVHRLSAEAEAMRRRSSRRNVISLERDYAERIEKVRSIPALPYRRPRDSVFFILSIIADASAVAAIVSIT